MKNQFLFLLVLLNYCLVTAQTINIPIITTDGVNPFPDTLRIGLDLTATDCIDSLIGEPTISPPTPPAGVFFSTFQLPSFCTPFMTTKLDFRNAPVFPYTGQKEHRLLWQLGFGSSSFTVFYNFPVGITANIKDAFGGTIFNQNLQDSGSYSIASPFTSALLTVYYDNVVPVEFYSFTSSFNGTYVSLNWVTVSETNNQGFEIERLKDQKIEKLNEWEKIGYIEGYGTTTNSNSYSFVDEDVSTGIYKYRLKQIDFDGTFTYSNEIEVEVYLPPKEFVLHQNYPNPFNPTTKIKFEIPQTETENPLQGGARGGLVTLKVYDILGNEVATLVNENKPAGTYEVEFSAKGRSASGGNAYNLSSGIYMYKLSVNDFFSIKKMILLK